MIVSRTSLNFEEKVHVTGTLNFSCEGGWKRENLKWSRKKERKGGNLTPFLTRSEALIRK
jgi:hypothetical protein